MNKNFILILNLTAVFVCAGEVLFANNLSDCEKDCNRAHSSIYREVPKNVMEQELHAWKVCMDECKYGSPMRDD